MIFFLQGIRRLGCRTAPSPALKQGASACKSRSCFRFWAIPKMPTSPYFATTRERCASYAALQRCFESFTFGQGYRQYHSEYYCFRPQRWISEGELLCDGRVNRCFVIIIFADAAAAAPLDAVFRCSRAATPRSTPTRQRWSCSCRFYERSLICTSDLTSLMHRKTKP
jgi:hypothetical protein